MKFTAPKNNPTTLFLKPVLCLIAIFVFAFTANSQATFSQQAKLTATDGANQDALGFSVAISGDTAVVGAPRNTGGTNLQNRGSAYVYVRSGGAWTFQQKLAPSDGAATDQFGYSVAISGNTIAVGRYNTTTGLNRADGKVYIFTRSGATWTETQTIQSNDVAQGDLFGNSLAFEGDTLVVGALNKNNGASFFQGAAYVFTRAGGAFTQQAKLVSSDGGLADFFGYSVALSGDTIVVGAPGQAGLGAASGRGWVYVFTRSGSSWSFQQKLLASDGAAGDAFGSAVAISGETIVVGARMDMIGTVGGQGSAYVFTRGGAAWSEQQKLLGVETTQRNDNFGYAVAVKGDTIAVGSPAHEIVPNIANHGAVYIFQRGGGSFSRTQKLIHDDPAPDALGQTLAFDGNSILAGAPSKNSARGAAYIFNLSQISFSPLGFDFDGDGKSDLSVFRPSNSGWYIERSSAGFAGLQFGFSTDRIVPADYDGDGKTDVAVWRESEGNFYILNSSNNSVRAENFGLSGDVPVTIGDWDGDDKADLSVYRNGTSGGGQSYFFYRGSNDNPSGNITYLPWGIDGDKPVRGDFDGDGKLDAAVFRPSNGVWYIRNSSDGAIRYETWGIATDRIVPADYDGDGKTDPAVYRDGSWYIRQSSNDQPRYETFGLASDQTTAADFDGDGKSDVAVFRNGIWYIKQSSSASVSYRTFGASGDRAIQSAFVQ